MLGQGAIIVPEDVYSLVVVPSGFLGEVIAFSYALGHPVPGLSAGHCATQIETNMRVANWSDRPNMWKALEWSVSRYLPALYQPQQLGPYNVTDDDLASFLNTADIQLYVSDGKPVLEFTPNLYDVRASAFRVVQRILFGQPVTVSKDDHLRLHLRFNTTAPVFGTHVASGKPASLAVMFRLVANLPEEEMKAEVAAASAFVPLAPKTSTFDTEIDELQQALIAQMGLPEAIVSPPNKNWHSVAVQAIATVGNLASALVASKADSVTIGGKKLNLRSGQEEPSKEDLVDPDALIDVERFRGM